MIFFARSWYRSELIDPERGVASLGLFAGHPADQARIGGDLYADLPAPRARERPGWRPERSPSGWPVLLSGWIDNDREIAAELHMPEASAAEVYGAAVEKWGDEADRRLIGSYASLVCLPDGEVRLARSPWGARSLFIFTDETTLLVSSITRPLFASGVPQKLRAGVIDGLLAFNLPDPGGTFFEGISTFRSGQVVRLGRQRRSEHAFYHRKDIAPVRFRRDADYVEAANALLGDAVKAALRDVRNPGVTLSGGLDSAIVCDEILRQRHGARTKSFTFGPLPEWDGRVVRHKFADDRPFVRAFAKQHPGLDTVFVDNRDIDFDYREQERFVAGSSFYSAQVLGSVYYGLYEAAREHGCDWLLFAGGGNITFSNDAPWASAEYFRNGKWGELRKLVDNRLNDPRPTWRKLLALGLMPNIPPALRSLVRRIIHGPGGADPFFNSLLRTDGRLARFARSRSGEKTIYSDGDPVSRQGFVDTMFDMSGQAAELWETEEQTFGIRMRDVTMYPPLVEFCFGLPTEQFAKGGETRRLARRMAEGRMPEGQRTNRLYGEHNVDWHARLTPRLPEIRARLVEIARHPELGPLVDTERALALVDDWPEHTPADTSLASQLRFSLPAVLSIARYTDFVSGRNLR
jgi:asparagine synthase (glutamine-hydrolysing)